MLKEDLIYRGKSKDVVEIKSGPYTGKYRLIFTDRATGYLENGKPVFDPGYDIVVGDIPGRFHERPGQVLELTELPVEPLCYTQDEFALMLADENPFILAALEEGMPV